MTPAPPTPKGVTLHPRQGVGVLQVDVAGHTQLLPLRQWELLQLAAALVQLAHHPDVAMAVRSPAPIIAGDGLPCTTDGAP